MVPLQYEQFEVLRRFSGFDMLDEGPVTGLGWPGGAGWHSARAGPAPSLQLHDARQTPHQSAGVRLAAGCRLWELRQPGCSATHPVWLPCSHCMFVGLTSEEEEAGSSSEDGSDSDDEGSSGSSEDSSSSSSDSEDDDSSSSGSGSSDSEEDEEGEEGSELMEGDLQQLR